MAQLHGYDPEAIGLGDYGKPGNYFERQIARWSKQYRASETEHIPEIDRLVEWLPQALPPQERISVVHGDYRLDNMIFHPTNPACSRCSTGSCRRSAIPWPTSPIC